jgi:hypothetical protein
MFTIFLLSIVVLPVLLGMRLAASRKMRRGLAILAGLLLTYDVVYVLMLYYLRHRWLR